jgi:hypothetical protein
MDSPRAVKWMDMHAHISSYSITVRPGKTYLRRASLVNDGFPAPGCCLARDPRPPPMNSGLITWMMHQRSSIRLAQQNLKLTQDEICLAPPQHLGRSNAFELAAQPSQRTRKIFSVNQTAN